MADATTLTFAFMRAHPADAARVLEAATTAEAVQLLTDAPVRIGGAVLAAMLPQVAATVLRGLGIERGRELLSALDAQHAVSILRQFDAAARVPYLAGLPTTTALTAKLLLEFVDNAVGAFMNPDVVALEGTMRVDAALGRLRHAEVAADRVYVINGNRGLIGVVSLAALLRASESIHLEALMTPAADRIAASSPLSGAVEHPGWRAANVLPVVDRRGRLLGEISRDSLERAARRIRPAQVEDASLAGLLANSYWQSFTGILELLTPLLPAGRPINPPREKP